jgi:hypothetical protein
MAPLGSSERDDEFRIREEEARAFARVIVGRLQERFEWSPKDRPSFYGSNEGKAADPAPAPRPKDQ